MPTATTASAEWFFITFSASKTICDRQCANADGEYARNGRQDIARQPTAASLRNLERQHSERVIVMRPIMRDYSR